MNLRSGLLVFAATATLLSMGCSTDDEGGDGAGGEGGGGGEAATSQVDLAGCGIPLACHVFQHTSPPQEEVVCIAQHVASRERVAVQWSVNAGPAPETARTWYYLLGDGTTIRQKADESCQGDECTGRTVGPQERCDLASYAELVASCDPDDDTDPDCQSFGVVENCQPIDELTCEGLLAFDPQGSD